MYTSRSAQCAFRFLGAYLMLLLTGVIASAAAPTWWTTKQVYRLDEEGAPVASLDYSIANQGQLKNLAVAAYEHLWDQLESPQPALGGIGSMTPPPNSNAPEGPSNRAGTGWRLIKLVSQWVEVDYNFTTGAGTRRVLRRVMNGLVPAQPEAWSPQGTGPRKLAAAVNRDDFSIVNQGQLKATAAPFYDRLNELYRKPNGVSFFPGDSYPKPWSGVANDTRHYEAANVGQLKNVFAFDLQQDSDYDGVSDVDEFKINEAIANGGGPGPGGSGPGGGYADIFEEDSDGDGILDGAEIAGGTSMGSDDSDGDGVKDRDDPAPTDPKLKAVLGLQKLGLVQVSPANKVVLGFALGDDGSVASYWDESPTSWGVSVWKDGVMQSTKTFPKEAMMGLDDGTGDFVLTTLEAVGVSSDGSLGGTATEKVPLPGSSARKGGFTWDDPQNGLVSYHFPMGAAKGYTAGGVLYGEFGRRVTCSAFYGVLYINWVIEAFVPSYFIGAQVITHDVDISTSNIELIEYKPAESIVICSATIKVDVREGSVLSPKVVSYGGASAFGEHSEISTSDYFTVAQPLNSNNLKYRLPTLNINRTAQGNKLWTSYDPIFSQTPDTTTEVKAIGDTGIATGNSPYVTQNPAAPANSAHPFFDDQDAYDSIDADLRGSVKLSQTLTLDSSANYKMLSAQVATRGTDPNGQVQWKDGLIVLTPSGLRSYDLAENGAPTQINSEGLMAGTKNSATHLYIPVSIFADTDRDGKIDIAKDTAGKDQWTNKRGAIYNVNFDRDGTRLVNDRKRPDAIHFDDDGLGVDEDYQIESGDGDIADITPIEITPFPKLPTGYKVILKVDEDEDLRAMHLFKRIQAGSQAIWGSYATPASDVPWVSDDSSPTDRERDITKWVVKEGSGETDMEKVSNGNFQLGIEGLVFRGMKLTNGTLDGAVANGAVGKFGGILAFVLELRKSDNSVIAVDKIQLKVAPWLALNNKLGVDKTYSSNRSSTFIASKNLDATRYGGMANTGNLSALASDTVWFQDHAEIGFTQRPGGPKNHVIFCLPYERREVDVPTWPIDNLLEANVGVFQLGQSIDLQAGGGSVGGNLEVRTPNPKQPLGLIVMGNKVGPVLSGFLAAQELQVNDRSFVADTNWLYVGHIDEICSFYRRDFVFYADPVLAINLLHRIPIANREGSVFFTKTKDAVIGVQTLAVNSPAKSIIYADTNGLIAGQIYYARFVNEFGGNRGWVAEVSVGGNGQLNVHQWWETGKTMEELRDKLFRASNNSSVFDAVPADNGVIGEVGDRLLIVKNSQMHISGSKVMPAFISVAEVLSDHTYAGVPGGLVGFTREIKRKIMSAVANIQKNDLPKKQYIGLPVLYLAKPLGSGLAQKAGFALSPNAANGHDINGVYYCPQQFSPVDSEGKDIYEEYIKKAVPEVVFVDDWEFYHTGFGEVHCGTNAKRTFVAWPDWWKSFPRN